eukprot:m.213989 g.213989  ORF g.213989 m.213989 type:complete len:356 (-) comp13796_c2_seq3:1327-2394(-)
MTGENGVNHVKTEPLSQEQADCNSSTHNTISETRENESNEHHQKQQNELQHEQQHEQQRGLIQLQQQDQETAEGGIINFSAACDAVKEEDEEDKHSQTEQLQPPKQQNQTKRKKKKRDGKRVARPMNSFMCFAKVYRSILQAQNPSLNNKDVSKLLGAKWRHLPDEERSVYNEQAQKLAQEHRKLHPDWKFTRSSKRKTGSEEALHSSSAMRSNSANANNACNFQQYSNENSTQTPPKKTKAIVNGQETSRGYTPSHHQNQPFQHLETSQQQYYQPLLQHLQFNSMYATPTLGTSQMLSTNSQQSSSLSSSTTTSTTPSPFGYYSSPSPVYAHPYPPPAYTFPPGYSEATRILHG